MKYIFTILFVFLLLKTHAQLMYQTRYEKAIFVETFGTSPIFSVNFEYLPVRWQKSFLSTRVGLGFIPGSSDQGASIPVSCTYNFLPGSIRGKIFKRVYNKCNPQPPKIDGETFIEMGGGYTFAAYTSGESRTFLFGILGVRTQVIFNIPPHPRAVFLRVIASPSYVVGKFEPRGGLGLGISL